MTETAERIKAELILLSLEERAELAQFLIQTLDAEQPDEDVEAAWDAELKLRAEEIKMGQAIGEPIEQALAELREKYS